MYVEKIELETTEYNQFEIITSRIEEIVKKSKIQNGFVTVITKHTTTGIMVNEALECLIYDIDQTLQRLIDEERPYRHARILQSYGSTAGNPTGHLKAMLTGNHCHFILKDGELLKGDAQDIYFCEFDGPSMRTIYITITKEEVEK